MRVIPFCLCFPIGEILYTHTDCGRYVKQTPNVKNSQKIHISHTTKIVFVNNFILPYVDMCGLSPDCSFQ